MQSPKLPFRVLLSFDLEEFDIPTEYGASPGMEEQLLVTHTGNQRLLPLLESMELPATFFTTAYYASHHTEEIKAMTGRHEIASHAFYHGRFEQEDIMKSRQLLSYISGQTITGFRMPRLAPLNRNLLLEAGYQYDSSLNPTWLPGRYNHLRRPRSMFNDKGLWVMPASVTPRLRIPLFWLAFKNLPLWFIKKCSLQVLKKDGYLTLYFHPWEYADIHAYTSLPRYVRNSCGYALLDKLEKYLQWLATLSSFQTMGSYIADQKNLAA